MTYLDLWDDWTNDKVDSYLIAELIYFEDRNTAFSMTIFMAVIFMIGAVVTVFMSDPQPTAWPFITFGLALLGFVIGIALRINGHLEVKRINRLRNIIERHRLKSQPNPYADDI